MSTQGDVFINLLPNECNIDYLDFPRSLTCTNIIPISKQEHVIDEFLGQWNFEIKS